MKRVWIFTGTGVVLISLFGWWHCQHEWLTDTLLAQVKLGMTKDQVEALLGKPENGYGLEGFTNNASPLGISPIFFTTRNKPWLANYQSDQLLIHIVAAGNERWVNAPLIWVDRERALILFINDSTGVCEILAYSITKTGGGFFSWLSWKWEDWMHGK